MQMCWQKMGPVCLTEMVPAQSLLLQEFLSGQWWILLLPVYGFRKSCLALSSVSEHFGSLIQAREKQGEDSRIRLDFPKGMSTSGWSQHARWCSYIDCLHYQHKLPPWHWSQEPGLLTLQFSLPCEGCWSLLLATEMRQMVVGSGTETANTAKLFCFCLSFLTANQR